jgi:hypothetical protein
MVLDQFGAIYKKSVIGDLPHIKIKFLKWGYLMKNAA